MDVLNTIPARVAIGRVSDGAGTVLMSAEFSRFLSGFLERVGGPTGVSTADLKSMLADLQKDLKGRPAVLAQTAIPVALSGTTDPTVLATVSIPAQSMGKNGMVRITTTWSMTNSANEKTVITRFGGSNVSLNAVTTATTYREQREVYNRAQADAQAFIFGGDSFTGAPLGTLSTNTAVAQNIDIVGQLSNASETMTLEAYTVELFPNS